MNEKDYQYYCTGCGLCHSERGTKFKRTEKGFPIADISTEELEFCKQCCPSGKNSDSFLSQGIWGNIDYIYGGWANDSSLRCKASSGGVLSAIAVWLLETKRVDVIIQTKAAKNNPLETETICSNTSKDVLECTGSRYSVSTPLYNLSEYIQEGKRYALFGRPCDILALKKYMRYTGKYQKEILYTFSFFCAGTPSPQANNRLLQAMGCSPEKCKNMTYRGNGWPGYTTVSDKDGKIYKMRYAESWANYLGRDIRPICRFCIDGTGAAADISCGDYWQLMNGKPDFGEHEGRNLIFCRSEKGRELIQKAKIDGVIHLCEFKEGKSNIHLVQPAQYERITTMYSKILAMKICGKAVPEYSKKLLRKFSKLNSVNTHLKIFYGTVQRIIKKKL